MRTSIEIMAVLMSIAALMQLRQASQRKDIPKDAATVSVRAGLLLTAVAVLAIYFGHQSEQGLQQALARNERLAEQLNAAREAESSLTEITQQLRQENAALASRNSQLSSQLLSQSWSDLTPAVGATAICNDGTLSYSQSRSGTCSWHGGVRTWL